MWNLTFKHLATFAATCLLALSCWGEPNLLSLEGGSNFRDMGGYPAANGMTVKHSSLFRSGVMTGLTANDMEFLDSIGFESIIDLRSEEEIELYPNHWASKSDIDYRTVNYSLVANFTDLAEQGVDPHDMMPMFYKQLHLTIKPQLELLFDELLAGNAPLVLNCSAGQDRTGLASALLLTALGVPRNYVMEDYLASTRLRDTRIEKGDVDLRAAAETNAFAAMMLAYGGEEPSPAQPLLTDDLRPYLSFTFEQLDRDYGSVFGYLEQELGVDEADIQRLRELYLTQG